jgi:hypothetical protein
MIAIKTYGPGNPEGYPADWPREVREGVNVLPPGFDLLLENKAEYEAYCAPMIEAAMAIGLANQPPPPPPSVPETVTRRQLFLWLNSVGITRAAIRAQLAAIPDETQREAALIEFDEAQEFARTHPLVVQLGQSLGFTNEQIDDGFRAAAAL